MDIRDFYRSLIQKQVPIIVDNSQLRSYLGDRGYETILFENYDFTKNQVVFTIVSDYDCYERLLALSNSSISTIVQLAAVRHDESLEAIVYEFDRVLGCKIEKNLERRSQIYDRIANSSEELYLADERGSDLKCWLAETLEVVNSENSLRSGYFYSISEFLEASIVNIQGNKSSFSVEGRLFFDGMIHGSTLRETKERNKEALSCLFRAVTSSREKYIEIEDNSIARLVIDGQDKTSLLLDLDLDAERKMSLTEIGFGCNAMLIERVDWKVNSIINRVIHGMHLGMGTAYNCPYVNFISQTIKIVED
ncbi:hypothetical protein [Moorena sp. SIO4G3]|uniref:hypothetical protein n=1 Tax=Moorena sp. SIO4G3 TaxID=2607821 RepID=UPI00142B5EA4|nr:hypothetical protein [Moorena sp. SIO4G3]NEO75448.1 hypothetical protein [Moorena sp. SIO4G3]